MTDDMNKSTDMPGGSARSGFSLVEVVVAMVMLAVCITSLAMLTTKTAQNAIRLQNGSGRQSFALQETNRVIAMPFDTIPNKVGCDTVQLNTALQYRRCLSQTLGTRYREVTIIVTPLKSGTYSDTIVLRRVSGAISNPLFTP